MIHQANNKNLFQRVLLTLFFSLLFVGVAGVAAAQIVVPQEFVSTGVAKGTEFCDDGTGAGERDKVRIPVSISIKASFPFFSATVTTPDFTISGSGNAFLKNRRSGVFVFDSASGMIMNTQYLTLSGKFKTNSAGEIVKLKGNFALQDRSGGPTLLGPVCITTGKFKMKTDPNPPPLRADR